MSEERIVLNGINALTGEYLVPLGKADIKREGTDLTIVTWSREVLFSLEAAAKLADEGISAEVVDLRSLVPLDKETMLSSVRKTRHCLVVHRERVRAAGARPPHGGRDHPA